LQEQWTFRGGTPKDGYYADDAHPHLAPNLGLTIGSDMHDDIVRWPDRPVIPGRVVVITVSFNTRELTALLLWSLR
jgi:hypothetical protein